MAAKIDALLKLSVIASLLLASSGVGYYYGIYLPGRDAQLDEERVLQKVRAYADKRAEQERLASEQREFEQRQAAAKVASEKEKAVAEVRYQTCLKDASFTRDASWAGECKRLADKALQDHADCLTKSNLSQGYCDTAYRSRDASANCTLPVTVATALDGDLNKARNRCLQERKAALE